MLQDFPISGLALCYGPLLLTILGFIAYAVVTDAHARRTYLRNMDQRSDNERLPDEPFSVSEPLDAETPSGMRVALLPDEHSDGEGPAVALPAGNVLPSSKGLTDNPPPRVPRTRPVRYVSSSELKSSEQPTDENPNSEG